MESDEIEKMALMHKLLTLVALISVILPGAVIGQRRGQRIDMLVTGGTIVTMDGERRVIEDGAVAVSNGRIVEVGKAAEMASRFNAKQTIDAKGKVIIPGLINGHTHVPMTLFRGLADDLDLNDWLTKYIFPAEARNVTEDFVRVGTQLGVAEMLKAGTTTFCDMYYFEDAIADETSKAGMRAVLGETVIDFPVADNKTNAEAMAYVERFVQKWKGNSLITPAVAPHAPYTVSEEHLKAIKRFSDRTGAPIVIHISETQKEVNDITTSKGLPPIEYLDRIGFLNDKVIAAHVVWPNEKELGILKRQNVGVVHNPQSNMKLASGVAPVPRMIADGIRLGIGTDGAASNNDLNVWEEIDTAAKLHKLISKDPRVVSAQQAFEMATIGGARALHMEKEIGSIEKGKRADLVIVDLDTLNQTPHYSVYSDLVYSTKAADVRTVIVEGRTVVRDGQLLTLDEQRIKERARVYRQKIVESLK
ncbi:MAG: 5-methylthioadenosine/S-adenosylhomocysteine deaminase [Blastocatellia bacterium]|nr:5-methylthioadenosine/S-adenosylhomocysteine deaminase [Blastocatellia bacterium]